MMNSDKPGPIEHDGPSLRHFEFIGIGAVTNQDILFLKAKVLFRGEFTLAIVLAGTRVAVNLLDEGRDLLRRRATVVPVVNGPFPVFTVVAMNSLTFACEHRKSLVSSPNSSHYFSN